MAPAETRPNRQAPRRGPPPAPATTSAVPRLWQALPPELRRRLAQELARLLGPMRPQSRSSAAPGIEEATHAEHADPR